MCIVDVSVYIHPFSRTNVHLGSTKTTKRNHRPSDDDDAAAPAVVADGDEYLAGCKRGGGRNGGLVMAKAGYHNILMVHGGLFVCWDAFRIRRQEVKVIHTSCSRAATAGGGGGVSLVQSR